MTPWCPLILQYHIMLLGQPNDTQLYYCNFEHISSQLTLPFLLALSEIHLTYLVPIKTGNGDGGPTIATVSRGGGGEQC